MLLNTAMAGITFFGWGNYDGFINSPVITENIVHPIIQRSQVPDES